MGIEIINRRNFFKVVTGFVAGIFASSVEGKKFNTEDFGGWNPKDGWSAGIDPESEWAKHGQRALAAQKEWAEADTMTATVGGYSNYIYICGVSDLNDTAIQEAIGLAEKYGCGIYLDKGISLYNIKAMNIKV